MKSFRLYNVSKPASNDWRAVRALGVFLLVITILITIPTISVVFSMGSGIELRGLLFGVVLAAVFWGLAGLVLHAAWRLAQESPTEDRRASHEE